MAIDFAAWAKSDPVTIFLVELSAQRLSDGLVLPLYLASRDRVLEGRYYLGCVAGLPRLTRQFNDTLTANHVPTWGDLVLNLEMDYRPDPGRTVTWLELLSPDWNLRYQPLTILVGGEDWDYAAFQPVFTGRTNNYSWTDGQLTLTLLDKGQDLIQKIPDYELPASPYVLEGSWNQVVPLPLGFVKNYKPPLVQGGLPGSYPWQYALAAGAIQEVTDVYYNDARLTPDYWQFQPKDVLPALKNASGAALMQTFGPYAGPLVRATWLVRICSTTTPNEDGHSGADVGLAWFWWSRDGGLTWSVPILSWLLAYDPASLAKAPALGTGTVAISGDYASQVKRPFKLKISTGGYFGTPAKFQLSTDGGLSYGPEITLANGDPIALAYGLSASFVDTRGAGPVTKSGSSVDGSLSVDGSANDLSAALAYIIKIIDSGDLGTATWRWSSDGGTTWSGPLSTSVSPTTLSHGVAVTFAGAMFITDDQFDFTVYPAFAVDDCWSFGQMEIPIPIDDGVAVQFFGAAHAGPVIKAPVDPVNPSLGQLTADASAYLLLVPEAFVLEITLAGAVGAAEYRWSRDNGDTWTTGVLTSESPVTLADNVAIAFVAGNLALGDRFSFTVYPKTGDQLLLNDEWSFPLASCLYLSVGGDGVNISVDVRGLLSQVSGYAGNAGEIIEALCLDWRGWTVADFDLVALAAFKAALPYELGLLVTSATAINSIIDSLLTGLPAFYTLTPAGQFFIQEIVPVSGDPVFEVSDFDFLSLPEGSDGDDNLYRQIIVGHDRNESANSNPQAGADPGRITWLKSAYRQVARRHDAILVAYPWAADLSLATCLKTQADAYALADKLMALYTVKHQTRTATVKISDFFLPLGAVGLYRRSRFGDQAGLLMAVRGQELSYADSNSTVILTLWR